MQHLNEDQPGLNIAEPANSPAEGATYPGATDAGRSHPASRWPTRTSTWRQSDQTPSGAPRGGIPHAYGFFYHTILQDKTPPSVPIILNVHFPHNTPKLHRCLELGRGLYRAITSFTGFKRVALMASGGLTHFVIDEDLDRKVIEAMKKPATRTRWPSCPENYFKVGTAEIKNWYPGDRGDERRRPHVSPGRLRPLLPLRSRHRQRDVLRLLGISVPTRFHRGTSGER